MNKIYAEYRSKREEKNLGKVVKKYLKRSDLLRRYNIGNTTFYRWLDSEEIKFPPPVYLSPRSPRWEESVIEEWEQKRKEASL